MKTKFLKEIEQPRSTNNYDTNALSQATALECKDPSLAKQEYLEESDINFIADRYGLTGEMPTVTQLPAYGDFSGIYDFQSAQNSVIQAKAQFMTLPAKMRSRFDNDPQKLLTFLDNPENKEEAIFLGLVNKPKDAPQSPLGDAKGEGKGDTLSPKPEPKAEPSPKKKPQDT